MKENTCSTIPKDSSRNLFRFLSLIFAISLTGLSFIIFQPPKSSNGQEQMDKRSVVVKNKQVVVENKQSDQQPDYEKQLPFFVSDCTNKNKWIHEEVKFFALHNPYFVRGDFDGGGSNDYVITVEDKKDKREGLLVCFNNKENKAVLLGLDPNNPPPFWRLLDWDVFTPGQVAETTDHKGDPVGIKPKGESIVMYWEDSIGIIYWDGTVFQWKLVILNQGD